MSKGAKVIVGVFASALAIIAMILCVVCCYVKTNRYIEASHDVRVVGNEPVFVVKYFNKETNTTKQLQKRLKDITEFERFILYAEKYETTLSSQEFYNVLVYSDIFGRINAFEIVLGE